MTVYDYVIVGAGSAGCVLAARLSEDPRCRVLVLEAGGSDRDKHIQIPVAFPKLFKSRHDWDFHTSSEKALADRELYWPRAKVLGGCSSMNAQMYVRGNPADYDLWEDQGNAGWGWDSVLPYFVRAEGYSRPMPGLNGGDGPLRVEELRSPNPTTTAFMRAAEQTGITRLDDVNGPTQEGVAFTRVNQRRGRRWSAADAYLRPAMRRGNLTVTTEVQVHRVRLDGKRAIGVDYMHRGSPMRVSCGEVILAGGAIGSPHLLMLSGVGPADTLRASGIEVVHELAGVGQNLQDHLACGSIMSCRQPITLVGAETLGNLLRFVVTGRGMLTSNLGEACAFVKTRPGLAAPDIELLFAPAPFADHGMRKPEGHAISIGSILLQPKSRGCLRLRQDDPRARPIIEANYLSDAGGEDLRTLVAGMELGRRIFRASAFEPFVGEELLPGPTMSIEDCIRQNAETLYHPVGTCRMGLDSQAVVDPTLRVRGLEGLRVVDASVMPTIIRGHTHAPTVMIAERAADLIRARVVLPSTLPRRRPPAPRQAAEMAPGRPDPAQH
jgi:choline dehydrogenase